MAMPNMSLSSNSSSEARGTSNSGFDNSGFVVNFGGSNSVGGLMGGLPEWFPMVAIAAAAFWLIKKRKG